MNGAVCISDISVEAIIRTVDRTVDEQLKKATARSHAYEDQEFELPAGFRQPLNLAAE
jgi:hypothetical protein